MKKTIKKQSVVDFGSAIARFWAGYGDFDGLAQRSEFWFTRLFLWPIDLVLFVFATMSNFALAIFILWYVFTLMPRMSQYTRRFRDARFSPRWYWIPTLVGVGLVLFFVLLWAASVGDVPEPTIPIMVIFFIYLVGMPIFGFSIFNIVIACLPSKLQNNPYR